MTENPHRCDSRQPRLMTWSVPMAEQPDVTALLLIDGFAGQPWEQQNWSPGTEPTSAHIDGDAK